MKRLAWTVAIVTISTASALAVGQDAPPPPAPEQPPGLAPGQAPDRAPDQGPATAKFDARQAPQQSPGQGPKQAPAVKYDAVQGPQQSPQQSPAQKGGGYSARMDSGYRSFSYEPDGWDAGYDGGGYDYGPRMSRGRRAAWADVTAKGTGRY